MYPSNSTPHAIRFVKVFLAESATVPNVLEKHRSVRWKRMKNESVAMKIPSSGCIAVVSDSVLLYFISSFVMECISLISERSDYQIQ